MYKNPISDIDEHWIDNLIGLSLNKRIEQAIHKQAQKETLAYLIDRANRGKSLQARMHETVFEAVTHKNKILDISLNKPNDLILDNFGTWLAGLVRMPVLATTSITLNDIVPSAQTVYTYGTAAPTFNTANSSTSGTQVQVGSGTTAAARANTNIQTAFGTAPESTRFSTGAGGYGGGSVSFSGAISAGGAGTVNETGFFGAWTNSANTLKYFMLFHDILGAGVAFVAGNTLTTSYSIAL